MAISSAHLLRAAAFAVPVVLVGARCGGGAVQPDRDAAQASPIRSAAVYSLPGVERCLTRHGVSSYADAAVAKPPYRKLLPPGLTGVLTGFRSVGSGTLLEWSKSTFDDGLLFFFKNAALARAGENRLADTFVYAQGLPKVSAQLIHAFGVPSAAAARQLYSASGNTVIIWEYPRQHAASSTRTLNDCLAANLK